MGRPLVSVVMATFERQHLLARSIVGYTLSKGITPREDLELVVVDDGSTDGTAEFVRAWSRVSNIRSVVVQPHPKPHGWRDCGAVLNHGIRASSGEYIIITHPEVIPGRKSITDCVHQLERFELNRDDTGHGPAYYMNRGLPIPQLGLYACCPVYYLSPRDQERIDTVPWADKGNLALREIEGFYDQDDNGNPDYRHDVTDRVATPGFRIPAWESWVFGGMSRKTWKILGGMLVTKHWGSVDIAFMERRRALHIPNHTTSDPEAIVAHQCHDLKDDVKTPRCMETWKKELSTYNLRDPRLLCWPEVDELGW